MSIFRVNTFKKALLLLFAFFAVCFAETIGLTPGGDITELNLNWYSDAGKGDSSLVLIFYANGKFDSMVSGTSGAASAGKIWHKATVKGLAAGAQYKYSVSNDGREWSEQYDYKAPAAGAFKFAVVGDPQLANETTAKNWAATVEKIAEAGASFIVGCGDQVDQHSPGSEQEYNYLFAPAALRSIPYAPAMGNHDAHNLLAYHFNLPNASKGNLDMQFNYFYLYNDVLFIALNTSPYATEANAGAYVANFESVIKAAKAANAKKYKWIVVYHHKSTQSVAVHAKDKDIEAYINAGFEKLMEKQGVDLVFSGHDHIFVRSNIAAKKPVYISLNTASGLKYYEPAVSSTHKQSQSKLPEYTIVNVGNTSMTVTTKTIEGGIIDEFTIRPAAK